MTLREPALLAAHATTVDHISSGRLELGVGAAGAPRDHGALGSPEWGPRERADRFAEYMEIVARALDGEGIDHSGSHYRVSSFRVTPPPLQNPIPLTIAALGHRTIAVAARWASTWNSLGFVDGRRVSGDEEIEVARSRVETLERACEEVERDPTTIGRSYLTSFGRRAPLPTVDEFADRVREFAGAGMTEIIINWPDDFSQLDALVAIAEALPELREL